ncbi:MAG: DMT family transporter [Pseudomonadota bacterium]
MPAGAEVTPADTARPTAAVLWMVVTGFCFVAFAAIVKALGDEVPAAQGAFLRFALVLPFLLPMLPALWRAFPRGTDLRLYLLRAVLHTGAVIAWFYAMARIPIAEMTAINYLIPVYVTLGASLFLGERLALRRIAAVAVAMVGALLILRPGFRELSSGHLAMLVTSLGLGASYLIGKALSARYSSSVIVALLSLTVTIGLLPFAIAEWVPLSLPQLGGYALCALFATVGHFCMTQAFRAAPVAITQPVTFLQLVWASALGVLVFSEPLDGFVLVGGSVIVAAVSFIAWREAVLKRRRTDQNHF